MKNHIEGGDVLVHDGHIFIGLSSRTQREGIKELEDELHKNGKKQKIIPIKFDSKMLHLDCVLNILDKDDCIICDYIYDKKAIKEIVKNCYNIDKKTADELGTNLICLGDKRVLSTHKKVCNMLNEKGFKAKYVDYSEIIKGGGSLTCTTLPIFSEKKD
jgi:N-dimethylarginine dimethylaminohydrolase